MGKCKYNCIGGTLYGFAGINRCDCPNGCRPNRSPEKGTMKLKHYIGQTVYLIHNNGVRTGLVRHIHIDHETKVKVTVRLNDPKAKEGDPNRDTSRPDSQVFESKEALIESL